VMSMGKRVSGAHWILLAVSMAACTGAAATSTSGHPATCEAGASADNGCIDGALDGSAAADGGPDATVVGPPGPDGGLDAAADAPGDASFDAADAVDAASVSDPCPVGVPYPAPDMVCDPKCSDAGPTAACNALKCGPTTTVMVGWDQGVHTGFPYSLRTPEAPGIDPNCVTQCPSGGYVYGFGLNTNMPYGFGAYTVKVGAPWEIIQASQVPYCTDAHSFPPRQCVWDDNASPDQFYIMTKDPNAPARNIVIELQPDNTKACK
jgi:hypothetical protein